MLSFLADTFVSFSICSLLFYTIDPYKGQEVQCVWK